jgi:putative phosphoribosyl transferase
MRGERGVVVLGLPRGGVPVAYEVATALDAPLDVVVVRKIGVPSQREVAMGAIGEGGVRVVDEQVIAAMGITAEQFSRVERTERVELERRMSQFRSHGAPLQLEGRTVVIVDDGVATGSTAKAACRVARAQGAARVVLAVPVAAAQAFASLRDEADEVIAVLTVEGSFAVGQWYDEFEQTSDNEVQEVLARGAKRVHDAEVIINTGTIELSGRLTIPLTATMVVVFAHDSGSSRHSSRSRSLAASLNQRGLATLLFDLLSEDEGLDRANVLDVDLLVSRLVGTTRWLRRQLGEDWDIGYFGASTGAAAAMIAAGDQSLGVTCIVVSGGRIDLAGGRLAAVVAPTLLIVGGDDSLLVALNASAQRELTCEHRLEMVEGATHLLEEPGALDRVCRLAGEWFDSHRSDGPRRASR